MVNPTPDQPSILSELRAIKTLIDQTSTSLRNQREMLKARRMNLPPMALQAISQLGKDVEAMESSLLTEQMELTRLRSLVETTALINSTLDVDQVLEKAMEIVISLTDAERGYIILIHPETDALEYRVIYESEVIPKQGGEPQISRTIINEVLETGEPLLADNAYKDERLSGGQSIAAFTLRSVLCVPLKYKGETLIGVVYVDNRLRAGVFEEREKELVASFANQAAIAIENARLYANIQRSLAEISQMKDLMDNVFASIGSGVITADVAHKVITFNQAAAAILERGEDITIGKPLGSVLPGVSANLDSYIARVREEDTEQVIDAEMEVEKRGRIALKMKLSALKDVQRNVQGVTMVIDDVTAQKRDEQRLGMARRYLPPEMVDDIHTIASLAFEGERREVTCMFVDVRSVTTFPQDFRPKQIMEQLNIYFSRATDVIHQHKGIIDKYMGNEIMALFNTQLNPMDDDHPLRAVQTALDIREAFLELYDELGINPDPHYYRVGIHTGVATLGNVGSLTRREFSAIGNTINMSKRFEENALYGQIIISPDVREVLLNNGLPDHIRLEAGEPVKLKGIENKVQIYEVFRT